jgi:hypothetical protein
MPRRSISRWVGDSLNVPEGYEMVMRKRHNRISNWQLFLKNNGEFKQFIDQMRTLYRQQYGGVPQPLGVWQKFLRDHGMKELMDRLSAQYRAQSGQGGYVYTGGRMRGRGISGGWTDYKRHLAGERMFEEGHNPWLNFIHEHKGDGYNLEELSQMYHQTYGKR